MTFILTLIILIIIVGIIISMSSEQQRKNANGETFEKFVTGNSFGSIGSGRSVTAILEYDQLHIYDNLNKELNVYLNYEKIVDVGLTSNKTIIEKSKSVAGRALAGGVLLGPVGALFGGMSGIGSKTHTEVKNYILISYTSAENNETNGILLEVGLNAWDKFMSELKEKANIVKEKSVTL